MADLETARSLFKKEFGFLESRFEIYEVPAHGAREAEGEHIWKPGAYVLYHPDFGILKVGRHLTNARKRALDHIRDNTGAGEPFEMKAMGADPRTRLMLFVVKDEKKDWHWPAALEIYLERELEPRIRSKRAG